MSKLALDEAHGGSVVGISQQGRGGIRTLWLMMLRVSAAAVRIHYDAPSAEKCCN